MVINDKYLLEELVYFSMKSQVWKVRDYTGSRVYCLKFEKHKQTDEKLLQMLCHKSIVMLYDTFDWEEYHVLVMSYCEGRTLEEIIRTGQAFTNKQLVNIVLQICEVLSYLHTKANPIYLLDLKASNIMMDILGDITLIDFGSAIEEHRMIDKTLSGTSAYMPPEYSKSGVYGSYTDSYCLGRLIERLIGHHSKGYKEWRSIIKGATRVSPEKRWSISNIKEAVLRCNKYT